MLAVDAGPTDTPILDETIGATVERGETGELCTRREGEEFLFTHPAVLDAQVVGVPDARYGEQLLAAIRLQPDAELTEDEIRAFCDGRIAHYKVPPYVQFVDDFPMTVTGKVQKHKLREEAIESVGLQAEAAVETA